MVYRIGHAGAAGHAPANTISSIKKALELEVDMVEFDVHLCHSGEVVVIHDKTVNRTTNGKGRVRDLPLSRLKELEVSEGDIYLLEKGKTESIPTLEEVLDVVDKRAEVNIEIKDVNAAGPVASVVSRYVEEKGWEAEDFIVSSFKTQALEIFRVACPDIKIGLLTFLPTRKTLRLAKKFKAYSINADYASLSESFVSLSHREGFKVFAFTADVPEDIEYLKTIGVDGIFSNYPERV
ncbi:MAG: glycerophosphodiester phosphodiesterase family protein [Candidatus Spechtbacterales bacterium]